MGDNEFFTIRQTAQALGISEKTVRRRIQKNELKAELKDSPYGKQYFISKGQINNAIQIIEAVQVKKEYDLQELAITLADYLDKRESNLVKTIDNLRETVENLKTDNENLQHKLQEQQLEGLQSIYNRLDEMNNKITLVNNKKGLKGFFNRNKGV